jgi:hypothetical protein
MYCIAERQICNGDKRNKEGLRKLPDAFEQNVLAARGGALAR